MRSFPTPGRSAPLALAMVSGLATSFMLYGFLTGGSKATATVMGHVVVARIAVDDKRPLQATDLSVVETTWAPPGSYAKPEDLAGRMPLVTVPMGQPILSSHLAPAGAGPGLWHRVPPGMRAVAVATNEVVGVGGFVKPGLKVDVIGVAQSGLAWESETIAQNVPVLAISQDDDSRKDDTAARVASSVTLLVSPQQAEAIALATEKGRIRLVLRAMGDNTVRKITPKPKPKPQVVHAAPAPRVVERQVYVPAPKPVAKPRPVPAAPAGIQVIRGKSIEVVNP